jgi:hypothetical protein
MTARRLQVLEEYADRVASGEWVSYAELARRCRLYDYREARRIVADLRKLGRI